jgi:hypothetical protein
MYEIHATVDVSSSVLVSFCIKGIDILVRYIFVSGNVCTKYWSKDTTSQNFQSIKVISWIIIRSANDCPSCICIQTYTYVVLWSGPVSLSTLNNDFTTGATYGQEYLLFFFFGVVQMKYLLASNPSKMLLLEL